MKLQLIFPALLASALVFSTGCTRDDGNNNTPIGGKGGSTTLNVTPQHHGVNIDSCTIYIKYNATNSPSSFDDSAQCVQIAGKPVATFTQLKKGNYYLYGKGWDPSILQNVKGGLPYVITQDGTINIFVPVTED